MDFAKKYYFFYVSISEYFVNRNKQNTALTFFLADCQLLANGNMIFRNEVPFGSNFNSDRQCPQKIHQKMDQYLNKYPAFSPGSVSNRATSVREHQGKVKNKR